MNYLDELAFAKDNVVSVLEAKGIRSHYLKFGGEGEPPVRKPTVPTAARSEFLANRALGDWAEKTLAAAIRNSHPEWQVTHYGKAETMSAGEEGFKTFYLDSLAEVRKYGKRPDLLIFSRQLSVADDISAEPFAKADPLVKDAIGALEVRSSKTEALIYMAVRAKDKKAGKNAAREVPSFTPKVEDLKIVYRWIERHRKPQAYVQVFLDSVFMINVLRIFQIIGSGAGFKIETPDKSQQKSTIMIPITSGEQVGRFNRLPTFMASEYVTRLGRHEPYVVPVGGDLQVDTVRIQALLLG